MIESYSVFTAEEFVISERSRNGLFIEYFNGRELFL